MEISNILYQKEVQFSTNGRNNYVHAVLGLTGATQHYMERSVMINSGQYNKML
jgi:hypothetical protein